MPPSALIAHSLHCGAGAQKQLLRLPECEWLDAEAQCGCRWCFLASVDKPDGRRNTAIHLTDGTFGVLTEPTILAKLKAT